MRAIVLILLWLGLLAACGQAATPPAPTMTVEDAFATIDADLHDP